MFPSRIRLACRRTLCSLVVWAVTAAKGVCSGSGASMMRIFVSRRDEASSIGDVEKREAAGLKSGHKSRQETYATLSQGLEVASR